MDVKPISRWNRQGTWLHMLTSFHSFVTVIVKEGLRLNIHGSPVPQHPVWVHSRENKPVINYKSRLGSLLLKKWTNGFRSSIWVGLSYISSFPGNFPHKTLVSKDQPGNTTLFLNLLLLPAWPEV